VHPFNANNFTDEDFLASYVTDRPFTSPVPSGGDGAGGSTVSGSGGGDGAGGSTVSGSGAHPKTPEMIRPFPQAPPRKQSVGRRKASSRILTKTPVKAALEAELVAREEKNRPKLKKKNSSDKPIVSKKRSMPNAGGKNSSKKFKIADVMAALF
jgi:hypothetical protein